MFCNGTGFYDLEVPVGHPNFHTVYRCPHHPASDDVELRQRLFRLSHLGQLSEKRFENFELDRFGLDEAEYRSLVLAFQSAQRFAESPKERWLLLHGGYGCGKTHLAAAVGNARLAHGDEVLFMTAPDLLDHLRGAFGNDSQMSYDQTFERVKAVGLLILDDLGVENPSPWALEKLFQLLNYRYNQKLPTIVTTNASLDALDGRIRSRLMDNNMVIFVGISAPDYRSNREDRTRFSNSLTSYAEYTFDRFTLEGANAEERMNITKALHAAYDYAQAPTPERPWLVILGDSGTGKTHLAAAIANQRHSLRQSLMFMSVPDLMDDLRETFNPNSTQTFDEKFQRVKNMPLLFLDDMINFDHAKPWVREKVMQIVKHRYISKLPTVFTLVNLNGLPPELLWRMSDMRLSRAVEITARAFVKRNLR
jgi:DNA replication protein DnaC